MEDNLIDILQSFQNDENYKELDAVDDILHLFSVVWQSEQLLAYTEWLKKEGLLNATVSKLIVKKYQSK